MTSQAASRFPFAAPEVAAWELWGLAGLVGFLLFAGLLDQSGSVLQPNLVAPLWLAVVLIAGAVLAVRRDGVAMWTGLVWMRLSTAVYFGIGSVADRVMNDTTLTMLHNFYAATDIEIARFNLLAALCSLVILATVALAAHLWPPRPDALPVEDNRLMLATGLLLGVPGFATKYLIIFPHSMGAFGEDVVLPGVLTQLVWLAPVSTFLLISWCLRNRSAWFLPLACLVLADAFFGLLRFISWWLRFPFCKR